MIEYIIVILVFFGWLMWKPNYFLVYFLFSLAGLLLLTSMISLIMGFSTVVFLGSLLLVLFFIFSLYLRKEFLIKSKGKKSSFKIILLLAYIIPFLVLGGVVYMNVVPFGGMTLEVGEDFERSGDVGVVDFDYVGSDDVVSLSVDNGYIYPPYLDKRFEIEFRVSDLTFNGSESVSYPKTSDRYESGDFSMFVRWTPEVSRSGQHIVDHGNWALRQDGEEFVFGVGGSKVNGSVDIGKEHTAQAFHSPEEYIVLYIDGRFADMKEIKSGVEDPGEDLTFGKSFKGQVKEFEFYDQVLEKRSDLLSEISKGENKFGIYGEEEVENIEIK